MERTTIMATVLEALTLAQVKGAQNLELKKAHSGFEYYFIFEIDLVHHAFKVVTESIVTIRTWEIHDKLKKLINEQEQE